MSASDEIVMQKKDAATPVTWSDYEHLRDHLTGIFMKSTEDLDATVQDVQLKLTENENTVNAIRADVATVQTSVQNIQQSIDALRLVVEHLQPQQPQQQQFDDADDDSVQGDNLNVNARGRAPPVRGRGFAPVGRAQRVPVPVQEDGLGKPKFSIPKFDGQGDVEEYLTWELKIEKLWRLHDYTEERKVKLASSEFDGYALRWWDSIVQN